MKILLILKSIHNVYKTTKKPEGVNTQKQGTIPYEEPNQSTKSISDIEPSPMYNLTQSQKRYKKKTFNCLVQACTILKSSPIFIPPYGPKEA